MNLEVDIIGKFLSKIPKMQTQKYIWVNCLDKWDDDFNPNVHLMLDFYSLKNQQNQFNHMELPAFWQTDERKEFPKLPTLCEFERYWIDTNCILKDEFGYYYKSINNIILKNQRTFGEKPCYIILFYPTSVKDGFKIAREIYEILKPDDKFICFTTNYWIEYYATLVHKPFWSIWSFLNPRMSLAITLYVLFHQI